MYNRPYRFGIIQDSSMVSTAIRLLDRERAISPEGMLNKEYHLGSATIHLRSKGDYDEITIFKVEPPKGSEILYTVSYSGLLAFDLNLNPIENTNDLNIMFTDDMFYNEDPSIPASDGDFVLRGTIIPENSLILVDALTDSAFPLTYNYYRVDSISDNEKKRHICSYPSYVYRRLQGYLGDFPIVYFNSNSYKKFNLRFMKYDKDVYFMGGLREYNNSKGGISEGSPLWYDMNDVLVHSVVYGIVVEYEYVNTTPAQLSGYYKIDLTLYDAVNYNTYTALIEGVKRPVEGSLTITPKIVIDPTVKYWIYDDSVSETEVTVGDASGFTYIIELTRIETNSGGGGYPPPEE